jgi:hypothetical protein
MSQLEVDKVIPQSGTTLTLGDSADTITIPSGATLDASNATLTLPDDSVTTAKIDDGAVTTVKIADANITTAKLAYDPNPFRNIVINGDMSIAQRSTSVASITASGYYTLDRWNIGASSLGTWTNTQSTDVPTGQGFATSFKLDCTTADASPAAGDYFQLNQSFEGQNLQYLKKGTANAVSLTASFWVKSTKTGTFICELLDLDNSRQISKSYTVDVTDTWEKKTITFEGDTTGALANDNGSSLVLSFWLGAGSTYSSGTLNTSWASITNANRAVGQVNIADSTSNDWYITGVQLEAGTTASDFEFLPVDVNLGRCQRYFYKIESSGTTSNNNITTGFTYGTAGVQSNVKMEVLMRATPSFSYDIGANGLVLYNNVDSVTASVPKVYAFAPFGGLMYFDSDLSGTFGASHRPVNVSFNTSPTQTKVLKFSAEL